MAEPVTDINILKEWAPVSDLLNKIPAKYQNGLFSYDICLTCIDILPEHIAVGTNIGLVYWYDRKKKDLQKLRCEIQNTKLNTVKIVSTVDYMVACGNSEGQITIFQIPKSHPDTLPENLKPKSKQVERYTVSDLHTSAITTLEWSKNGMKLFSGDQNGLIVLTEIDFYMHLSKSVDILNEAYEVVQLNYCQQYLLVSTVYRTIICQKEDKWKVCQVGKKDRKSLGKLGAIFWKNSLKPQDLAIFCTRPGLRIWISDLEGTVQKTLLFKDLLNHECFEVPLINPITGFAKKLKPSKEATFGVILPFSDNLLVTYSSEVIYVLDPVNLLVIATISHLRRILSVAVHKDEIFVLEGERSIVRISFKTEPISNDIMTSSVTTVSSFLPLANSLKDLANKIQTSSIISALPPLFESDFSIHTDSTSVINAEEALELPPVKKFPANVILKVVNNSSPRKEINTGIECRDTMTESTKKWEEFHKISEEEFDDHILFRHRRRRKKNKMGGDMNTSVTSLSSTSSEERDGNVNVNKPCLLNVSMIDTLMPDLRSPDTILNDIENKEKMLADILQLDKIKFSTFENETSKIKEKITQNETSYNNSPAVKNKPSTVVSPCNSRDGSNKSAQLTDPLQKKIATSMYSEVKKINNFSAPTRECNFAIGSRIVDSTPDSECNGYDIAKDLTNSASHYVEQKDQNIMKSNYKRKQDTTEISVMSYGPPSGSSNPNSIDPPACMAIPNVWKLQEITINQDGSEASDNSLCDWEIV